MGMKCRTALLGTIAALTLGVSAASAVTIGGIGIPPGPKLFVDTDFETRITCAADASVPCTPGHTPADFFGISRVNTLSNDGALGGTYGGADFPPPPPPPPFLYGEFSNFVVRHITPPTASTAG